MIKSLIPTLSIDKIIALSRAAGEILMYYYHKKDISINIKADNSPVSVADIESNNLICQELLRLYPQIPIISEECENSAIAQEIFWSIDPLDGTKSFLNKGGEFTINIGLVVNKLPVIGVLYAPLCDELYYVGEDGIACKQSSGPIKTRKVPSEGLTVLTSALSTNYRQLNEYLLSKKVNKIINSSSALKICLIAEGKADLYPRFGQTMEWDIAAGHAILNAAGGSIKDFDNNDLSYGHGNRSYANPDFVAQGN